MPVKKSKLPLKKERKLPGGKERKEDLKEYINAEFTEMVKNRKDPPDPVRVNLLKAAMQWILIRERLPDGELGKFFEDLKEEGDNGTK